MIGGFSFLLFLVLFEHRIHLPAWVQVAGRMHPMLLHFPIVLLSLYFLSFWIGSKENRGWVDGVRLLAVFTALITAISGLLLSVEAAQEGTTFLRHKWGGLLLAFFSFLLYFLHPYLVQKRWLARPITLVAAFFLMLTGHWGANLTHGENFLLEPIAGMEQEKVPLEKAVAFAHIVKPILDGKCSSCHGGSSTKGGLSLADTAALLEGGKTGPLFVAGSPDSSLLIKRILLPPEDKKHMAPKSKPQLTEAEIALLQAWVKAGAPLDEKIISLPQEDSFRLLATAWLAPADGANQVAYTFPAAPEDKIRALNNNYRMVAPLGKGSPALTVQFYGAVGYSPKALEELLGVKEQVTQLSLSRLPVKDEHLKLLLQLRNLQRLNLNYTDVTEKGVQQLAGLPKLEELSLAGVQLSPRVAAQLVAMPAIKNLYLWNTTLDSGSVASLLLRKKGVRIETGFKDDGQVVFPLNPPVAKTTPGIYDPSSLIELKHPFRGVEIRYTLDGSEPDSVQSAVYKNPLPLDGFTVVKARAFKQGWFGSKTMKAVYFTKGIQPDSIEAVASGALTRKKEPRLFDQEIGDLNLSSGAWVEVNNPTTYMLYFEKPVAVRQLSMNTFVRTEWDIFPAAKVEVWGGMNSKGLKPLATWSKAPPTQWEEPDLQQPLLQFAPTEVKCLQVVVHPVRSIPAWRPSKGKPSKVFVGEMVVN